MTATDNQNENETTDNRTVDELIEVTNQSSPLCWSGYIALGLDKSDKSIQALGDLLNNKDWTHTRAAIQAIGQNMNGLQHENKLLNFLNHSNRFILTATIRALSNLKSIKAHDKIKSLISSDDLDIKQIAIEDLSNIWEPTDFNFLIDLYSLTENDKIRKAIGFVLDYHCNADNWKLFFNTFSNDNIVRHREMALKVANNFSDDKTIIQSFLKDTDGHIRKKAQTLTKMGSR